MPPLTAVDVLDVLIVAFVLYKLMMLIRGTRATAILKGLLVLFLASLGARYLGLRTVSWLLDRGTTVILVALPVVFYPELRRALEHLGRGPLLSRVGLLGREDLSRLLEEIVRGTRKLAESRLGGLIAIEREVGLEEFIETGVRLDAVVSRELILNIFSPNTPLHDGAAILRGDRIAAAACFLPLSDNPNLASELGTRHRAAIGLSEQSDAIVLVVSEETGIISMAMGGQLERGLDEATLRERLTESLPVNGLSRGFGRREA